MVEVEVNKTTIFRSDILHMQKSKKIHKLARTLNRNFITRRIHQSVFLAHIHIINGFAMQKKKKIKRIIDGAEKMEFNKRMSA